VRDLEGYGLIECQVADRVTRKMLALYLNALDRDRKNHQLLLALFPRLLRQSVASLEDGNHRAFLSELQKCGEIVLDVVTCNVSVRSDVPLTMLQAVFELREAYLSPHASVLFGEHYSALRQEHLTEVVLDAARKSLKSEDDSDRLLEVVRMMFRPSTARAAAAPTAESPNYGLIRKKQRQNPNVKTGLEGDPIIKINEN
jgi:hypothetical protein